MKSSADEVIQKGRPPIDQAQRARDRRRRVLERGLIAGYELLDGIRREMAELDAADRDAAPKAPISGSDMTGGTTE